MERKSLFNISSNIQLKPCKENSIHQNSRAYKFQDFTAILNTPKTSFFKDIKNKILSSSNPLDVSMKEIEKFSDLSQNILESENSDTKSVKSQSSNKSNSKITLNIKDFLYEDYSSYYNKIKNPYKTFSMNHKKKIHKGSAISLSLETKNHFSQTPHIKRINSIISDKSTNSNTTNKTNKTPNKLESILDEEIYNSQVHQIQQSVGSEYFNHKSYQIKDSFLNTQLFEIQSTIMQLVEKSGICEKEVSKILIHSNMIYHYILDNKYIHNNISEALETIFFTKVKFAKIKHSIIDNGIQYVSKNRRKEKIDNLMKHFEPLQALKKMINDLKDLNNTDINHISQYETQMNKILEEDPTIEKYKLFILIKQKITEMKLELQKDSINDFILIIKNDYNNAFNYLTKFKKEIDTSNNSNSSTKNEESDKSNSYLASEEIYNKLTEKLELKDTEISKEEILNTISNIKSFRSIQQLSNKESLQAMFEISNDIASTNKIYESLLFLNDKVSSTSVLLIELKTIFNSNIAESIRLIKDSLYKSIYYKKQDEMTNTEKNHLDQIFLYIFSEELVHAHNYTNSLINFFNTQINKLPEEKKPIKEDISQILQEFDEKTRSLMNFSINSFIENCLANYYSNLNIEEFFKVNNKLLFCCQNYISNTKTDVSSLLSKSYSDFIFQFFEEKNEKLKESIDCDDYSPVTIVSPVYQHIINFICNCDFKELSKLSQHDLIKLLENNASFVNIEDEKGIDINEELLNKGLLSINNKTFKCCCSIFEMVKFLYDIVKLFLIFDRSFQEQIFFQSTKIFDAVINHTRNNILEGIGYEKGIFKSITQNIILMLIAKLSFFKCLVENLSEKVKSSVSNEIIDCQFEKVVKNISNIKEQARDRILKMTEKKIQEALQEVKEINFTEYKILDGDVNNYTKIIIFILPKIYLASENCLENEEIISLFTSLLNQFFEGLDVIFREKTKFDNEAKAKQFKKDMLNLKKSMSNFPKLDTTWVKSKTDNYNKMLIPDNLISKKKKQNNKEE